jgi:hypothetical protein
VHDTTPIAHQYGDCHRYADRHSNAERHTDHARRAATLHVLTKFR